MFSKLAHHLRQNNNKEILSAVFSEGGRVEAEELLVNESFNGTGQRVHILDEVS